MTDRAKIEVEDLLKIVLVLVVVWLILESPAKCSNARSGCSARCARYWDSSSSS